MRFGLQELRRTHGEPSCSGAVETQTLRFDLRQLFDARITRGEVQLNAESLYGYMKKLPALTLRFDLR